MSDGKNSKGDGDRLLYCSFCGKSQHEVRKLIAGPSVFICDECVELCNDIIREEIQEKTGATGASKLPIPIEINEILVAGHGLAGFLVPGHESRVSDRFRQLRDSDFNAHLGFPFGLAGFRRTGSPDIEVQCGFDERLLLLQM